MDLSLLKALSEADAIASSEQEVRQILLELAGRLAEHHGTGSRLPEVTFPDIQGRQRFIFHGKADHLQVIPRPYGICH